MPEDEDDATPTEQARKIVLYLRNADMTGPRDPWAQQFAEQILEPITKAFQPQGHEVARASIQATFDVITNQLELSIQKMTADNGIYRILRQRNAMATIARSFVLPTAEGLRSAEGLMLDFIPRQPEAAQEVQQLAVEITTDSEKRKVVERITGGLKRSDVAGLTPWAFLVVLWWLLSQYAENPGTEVSNQLAVFAIIVALATIIQTRK